jgi:hypothetical protein
MLPFTTRSSVDTRAILLSQAKMLRLAAAMSQLSAGAASRISPDGTWELQRAVR